MNRIKPELKNDPADILGDSPEQEYTFLLVPVQVYSLVAQYAKKEQCSVGEVFQKALLKYLTDADSDKSSQPEREQPAKQPEIVVSRKRR